MSCLLPTPHQLIARYRANSNGEREQQQRESPGRAMALNTIVGEKSAMRIVVLADHGPVKPSQFTPKFGEWMT